MEMISLLLPLMMVSFASADYHITIVVQSIEFQAPNNTLADGSCCDSTCGEDGECCDNGCSPSMRLCFRGSQHSTDDPSCPLLKVSRSETQTLVVFGVNNSPIQKYYTGGFQVYTRIAHKMGDTADFDPPFDDPLIDEAFLEFMIPAVSYSDRFYSPAQLIVTTGMFGRMEIKMAVVVHCAAGWSGNACECSSNGCISEPLAPSSTEGVLTSENGINAVGIAVGVPVGVVILILVVVLVVVIVIKKKTIWRRSFKPSSLSYTLQTKRNIRAMRPDFKEPLTGNNTDDLYATISRKKKVSDDDEVPPPVPPFVGEHTEQQDHQDEVYQNFAVINHEVN